MQVNSNSELVQKKNAGRGRWSKSEHDRFMKGLEKFGKDWISVQKFVKTRSLTQVRSHAQKVFLHMEEVDIDALFEREDENYHKNGRRPFSKHWQQEQVDFNIELEETHQSKPVIRKQVDLVQLFMQAIEQQRKQMAAEQEQMRLSNLDGNGNFSQIENNRNANMI